MEGICSGRNGESGLKSLDALASGGACRHVRGLGVGKLRELHQRFQSRVELRLKLSGRLSMVPHGHD